MRVIIILIVLISSVLSGDSRFHVKNDVVVDQYSKLMWQRGDDGVKKNWKDADKYCKELQLNGYKDWRLPSIDELVSIVDKNRFAPAINTKVFNCKNSYYWSSTEAVEKGVEVTDARGVLFKSGYNIRYYKSYKDYVRCVRDSDVQN